MDSGYFSDASMANKYINNMRPAFRKRALFSDTTSDYLTPMEPNPYGQVSIRFRAGKNNIDKVYLVTRRERHLMSKERTEGEFDYYVCRVQLENTEFFYHFEVCLGKITYYYDKRGPVKEAQDYYDFSVIPGFRTPDWAKGAVMYQIYVDRFCNGDKSNDVETNEYRYIGEGVTKVEDWNKFPAEMGVREFYGGDLQGVINKLDYLQDLGIEVIYFNPLFVSPSNHKYDIQDYDNIDPHIGKIVEESGDVLDPGAYENRFATKYISRVTSKTNLDASNALFARLVEEAHSRGMRVILDGVFNHCGSFNKWMDRERIYEEAEGYEKGAFVSADSPYRNYFKFYHDAWPYNNTYDGWWGHDTLPKLNYEESQQLYDYIMYIARKWVSPPYNVDGWRLDVAADLGHSPEFNHKFWRDFRKNVKQANPDAIILAEHYGDPRSWLAGNEWDTVMNYDAFMEPLTWFLTGMEKHSDDYREDLYGNADSFWGSMLHYMSSFSGPSLQVAMNELSNHDHSRFLTRTNRKVGRMNTLGPHAAGEGINKAVFREAVVMQFTWPGAPTIYYGDEAGVCGFTDPDNRRTYPWGNEDHELIDFHKVMIDIRRNHEELRRGSLKRMNEAYNVITYGRFTMKNQIAVVLNNNHHMEEVNLPVWEIGVPNQAVMYQLVRTDSDGFDTKPREYRVVAGKIKLNMPPFSAIVLKRRREGFIKSFFSTR